MYRSIRRRGRCRRRSPSASLNAKLVRLKAKRPTDVLIGDNGRGQREVQVLYSEPANREIYMFTDNRLSRIVKPGQPEQQG